MINIAESTVVAKGAPSSRGTFRLLIKQIPLPLLPLFIFLTIFFFWPIGEVALNAFKDNDGAYTLSNIQLLFQDPYRLAFRNSISLGFISALVGSVIGLLLSIAIEKRGSVKLKKFVASISGVLANTGGVPLAFMFLAAFGPEGLMITFLKSLGIDLYDLGFTLFSFAGLVIVYSYFQIPIMIIVFSPAVSSLRREWQESAENLGASRYAYWVRVGIPILLPSFLASFLLLFASAFSAFATARAMTVGNIALVPLVIGSLLDGNVTINQANLGYALALGMIVISILAMVPYLYIQSRTSKWQQ
jgi:putative spermidine/putrescine transport system permease protein